MSQLTAALKTGSLVWQFSGPKEVKAILGAPQGEENLSDGGMEILLYRYDTGLVVLFGRESSSPKIEFQIGPALPLRSR